MRARRTWHGPPVLLVLLAGCVEGGKVEQLAPLDAGHYAAQVQPYVAEACGTLDCHGEPGRPLRIYSELGLRMEDGLRPRALADGVDPLMLSAAELEQNLRAFRALEPAHRAGDERLALSKPLAEAAGGVAHVGGVVFGSIDEPGYLCLLEWLSGEVSDAMHCDEALEALGGGM